MANFGNLWQLLVTFGYWWHLMATFGSLWQHLATEGNLWQLFAAYGNLWQLMATDGNFWQLMATDSYYYGNFWQHFGDACKLESLCAEYSFLLNLYLYWIYALCSNNLGNEFQLNVYVPSPESHGLFEIWLKIGNHFFGGRNIKKRCPPVEKWQKLSFVEILCIIHYFTLRGPAKFVYKIFLG